jgi:hypothetical protein
MNYRCGCSKTSILYKLLPFLIIFIFLFSCKTVNVKDGATLSAKKAEGFMFASIVTNIPGLSINLFPRNEKSDRGFLARAAAVFDKLYLGENFILIKLSSGNYTFKHIYFNDRLMPIEMEDIVFQIKENKINYIGKLFILKNEDTGEIHCYFADDYEIAFAFLDLEYPIIKNTYPIEMP